MSHLYSHSHNVNELALGPLQLLLGPCPLGLGEGPWPCRPAPYATPAGPVWVCGKDWGGSPPGQPMNRPYMHS